MSDKNKASWNNGAVKYSSFNHSEKFMKRITDNPANTFHRTTWEDDKQICSKLKR